MVNTRDRWWTFAIVCAALFMAMLDNLVVITALPAIQRALHASVSDLEWTVNAYTLAFAVLMLTGAALGDRFGRKRVFLVGIIIFTAGSALAAMSDSSSTLLIARAVQGTGAALVTPLTLTLLAVAFPPERRAAIIGLWAGVSGLGLAIGPLVGGAIVSGIQWNAIFWVNVPVGIVVAILGALRLHESRNESAAVDPIGVALAAGGLFGLTFALVRGNADGWTSAEILGSFVAGALLILAFVLWERRVATPMLDLRLFRSRPFSASNSVGFLMSAGMFGSIFLLTLFVQTVQHATPLEAGLKTMPWTGTIMVVAPIAGQLAGRLGVRPVVLAGMLLQAGALIWIGVVASVSTGYGTILPAFFLGGAGMGLTFAPLSTAVINGVSPDREGQASGGYNAIRELGGVFGIAILGAVFQHIDTLPTAVSFVDGFRAAVFFGGGIVLIGAALALLLPGVTRHAHRSEPAPSTTMEAVRVQV